MKMSLFEPQLNEIEHLLKSHNLLKSRHIPTFPTHLASTFRHLSYTEVWEKCYKERMFHFLLTDYSMFIFKISYNNSVDLSYSFLDCPFHFISYEDFLEELGLTVEEVGDELREDYEMELAASHLNDGAVPIRYDYDMPSYRSGVHPASHIHFGHENNIRLGTERILQPISFVFFVIRQFYPSAWSEFIDYNTNAPTLCRRVRENLDNVDNAFLQTKDYWELILK